MAQTIKLRRSSVQGKVPHTSSLALGELAINTFDGRAFIHRSGSGNDSTIQHLITTNAETTGSINLIGSITASGNISASGDIYATNFIGTVANATNADTLDSLDSTQFVRSDADDTVTGDITFGSEAKLIGTQASTTQDFSILEKFLANPASENGEQADVRILNNLAGANKWATITLTDCYQSDRTTAVTDLGDNPFDGTSAFKQLYQNAAGDPLVIQIDLPNQINWSAWVGIVFGHPSWRTKSVKIETFRNGAWQTECDLTNQASHIVSRKVANNDSNGVTKIKYTLDDLQNTDNHYIRILSLFNFNYRTGAESYGGVHYIDKYKDSAHYSIIYPASGNVDLGRNGDRYRNVYAEDVTINDWGSVSESLASIQTAGGVNGSGATNKVAIWTDANTLTSDTNLHFDSVNDRLGIGTDAPSEALELGSGDKIKLQSGNSPTGSILFKVNDEQTLFSSFNTSANGDPQQFEIKHNLGNTELINRRGDLILSSSTQRIGINAQHPTVDLQVGGDISASGNFHVKGDVGIGTISPTAKLHISSSVSDAIRIETEGSANQQGAQLFIHGNKQEGSPSRTTIIELKGNSLTRARGIEFTQTATPDKKWYAGTAYNIDGYTIGYTSHNNTQGPEYLASSSLFIKHDSNVGIGETSPSAKLHISQSTSSPGLIVDGGSGGNLIAKFRRSEGVSPSADGFVGIHLSDSDAQIRFEPVIETRHWSIGASNNSPGNFVFATSSKISGNEVAHINRDGGVYAASVTASGEISSSGNLFANLSDANGSYNNTVVYDTSTGQLYYTGSYGGGGSSVSAVLAAELSASLVSAVGGVEDGNGFDAGATLESVLRAILVQFVPPTFSSFIVTGLDGTLEVGSTEQSTINGGTFVTASSTSNGTGFENNGGSFALALTGNATDDGAISATYSGNGSISFTSPSSITIKRTTAGNVVFNLTGTDQEGNTTVKSDQAGFRLPIFYGGSSNDGSGGNDAALADILGDISSSIASTSNTSGITLLTTLTSTYGQQTLINTTSGTNLPSNMKISLPSSVAVGSNYTYIVIPSAYGNLTSMLKNGVQDEFGTFSNGVPLFTANHERFSGVNTEYNVFRSSGQNAFAQGDTLTFND